MSYSSLEVYYKTIWSLTFHHKYTIADLEEIAPFERDILLELTSEYIKKQQEEQDQVRNRSMLYG
jgi:hypothetical protein